MNLGLPEPFPTLDVDDDRNPAIRLFGKRFFNNQYAVELLAELLLVSCCDKRVEGGEPILGFLPALDAVRTWPPARRLEYRPPVKLNLKLFAFLAASRLDSRHRVHQEQHRRLTQALADRIRTSDGPATEPVEWLEDLLQGFQGAGANRAWCTQTFLPVSASLLTREVLWSESSARRQPVRDWAETVERFDAYYSTSKRNFLARGGEVLYLQLCNALATDQVRLAAFVEELRVAEPASITRAEADPTSLHATLQRGLAQLRGTRAAGLNRLVGVIEGLDPDTAAAVNENREGGGWVKCEWCPRESWREGYLFAIELSRVLRARLDPVERLELLTTGCALQVLRSLCAQSARYASVGGASAGNPLGFAWLFTPPEAASRPLRLASQRNLQAVQGLIQRALRTDELQRNASFHGPSTGRATAERLYREADTRYGHKLLLTLGKKLGLIAPRRGPGARFVMTNDALRYLVLALLGPGDRCTYDDFLRRLYLHYGIAVEGDLLTAAAAWSGLPANRTIQPEDSWLARTLRAGGFLAELSDACSVIRNTYDPVES